MIDPKGAKWRKSSRSGGASGSCVELACAPDVIAVRDSKNPTGPVLTFTRDTVMELLAEVRCGKLDG